MGINTVFYKHYSSKDVQGSTKYFTNTILVKMYGPQYSILQAQF